MSKDKKYGLIVPKKTQLSAPKAGNVFGNDDDSDGDDGVDWVKKALKAEGEKNKVKKQTKLDMQKALHDDPTIYQYDEVYDDMEKAKELTKPVKKETKKPKYIHNLLKAAERRKIDQEHRMERQVQKEREAEGEIYADKESFVTSAYRAKLEQFKKIEEEEERMDRLETMADVTKQPDMSGFHRHLFAQKFEGEKSTEDSDDKGESLTKDKHISLPPNIDKDEDLSSDSSSDSHSDESEQEEKEKMKKSSKARNSRQYRKRKVDESDSESEEEPPQKSDEEEKHRETTPKRPQEEEKPESSHKKPKLDNDDADDHEEDDKKQERSTENKRTKEKEFKIPEPKPEKPSEENEEKEKEVKKPERKINIWEKRTVGAVFEAAVQRYQERKRLRLSGR